MSDKPDVAALAQLARLEVSDAELKQLEGELPAILSFVETIQNASAEQEDEPASPAHRNVMRADEDAYAGGSFTERLVNAAPMREGDRIVVKQVVSRKNKEN